MSQHENPEQRRARIERERDNLERELQRALTVTAAIIVKYGEGDAVRTVRLDPADLEAIEAHPPTVYREDDSGMLVLRVVRP